MHKVCVSLVELKCLGRHLADDRGYTLSLVSAVQYAVLMVPIESEVFVRTSLPRLTQRREH